MPINTHIRELLESSRTIAVVGISATTGRPSNGIARMLVRAGYDVIPVNPSLTEWEGRTCYPSLREVPRPIDIVNIFRKSEDAGAVVDEAIAVGARSVWMQLGVVDEAAAQRALDAGLHVVMDRCISIELA